MISTKSLFISGTLIDKKNIQDVTEFLDNMKNWFFLIICHFIHLYTFIYSYSLFEVSDRKSVKELGQDIFLIMSNCLFLLSSFCFFT